MNKMKLPLTFIGLIAISFRLLAQTPEFSWAKKFGGSNLDETSAITGDQKGNIYAVGSFWGTVDFDPTANTYNVSSAGARDIFINAQDSTGKHLWTVSIGGDKTEIANDVAIDDQNSMYVVGQFQGSTDFNPSESKFIVSSTGQYDGFICKLGLQTGFAWMVRIGSPKDVSVNSVTTDKNGNVFVTGYLQGTVNFSTNEGGKEFVTSKGESDAFVAKYNSSGQFQWVRHFGGLDYIVGKAISVDTNGNAYVTGFFKETVVIDTIKGVQLTSKGQTDTYVVKLDASGKTLWARHIGGQGFESCNDIQLNSKGDIILAGQFEGNTDFDPSNGTYTLPAKGGGDVFVLKLTNQGGFVWARQMGGYSSDNANALSIDKFDNIYTTGRFSRTADFDPGIEEFNLSSFANSTDIFVSRLTSEGNFSWAIQLGSSQNGEEGVDIYINDHKEVYTAGYFQGLADFNHTLASNDLMSAGLTDGYLHKLNQCVKSVTDTIVTCRAFSWLDGNTYNTSNNSATQFLSSDSAHSCDRFVTLNLTIDTFDLNIDLAGSILTSKELDATYQWVNCDSNYKAIGGANSASYFVRELGNYAVVLTKNSCSDTSNCVNVASLGNRSIKHLPLQLYPNPVNDKLFLKTGDKSVNSVIVMSLIGNIVKEITDDVSVIDVSDLSNGLYLVRVFNKEEVYSFRIVKE